MNLLYFHWFIVKIECTYISTVHVFIVCKYVCIIRTNHLDSEHSLKMYSVVIFDESDLVAVVPDDWIFHDDNGDLMSHWPPAYLSVTVII